MEVTAHPAVPGTSPAVVRRWLGSDTALLVLLLAITAALRVWLLCHKEVPARDSISFISLAWQFEHRPWLQALKDAEQHPAYPLLVLAASVPVRAWAPAPDALLMQFAAQLVSVVAGTLLVIPMFYLGRELFSRGVGFWAALLFQCLPASSRVLSDGISEATFLLFATTGLFCGVLGLHRRRAWYFAACGVCGGLAYLTRPEGGLIVGVAGPGL